MDETTRQRLLELKYGLLSDDETAALRRRIEAEPALARACEEAKATAALLGEAARLTVPEVPLKRPETAMSTPSEPPPQAAVRSNGRIVRPWARLANWVVGLAAGILLLMSLGGYWYHRGQLRELASENMRLRVTGPAILQAGVDNTYRIDTSAITGAGMPSEIEFAVYSTDQKRLLWHKDTTGADGYLEVSVPADMKLPETAVLKVAALRADDGQQEQPEMVETRVRVEPIRHVTHLALDKPLYRPGETVYYRSLTLSRFGLAAEQEMPVHFEILDPGGAVVPDSQLEGVTQRGVGNGAFPIPAGIAGGEYTLVVRSLDDAFPEQKRPFAIRRYRLPRLKKELEFARDSYSPGDTVVADFLAERADGGPAAGASLRVLATLDGQTVHEEQAEADDAGAYRVEFDLPKKIERGDAQLAVIVDDGGTRETAAETIPINLGRVDVEFFPEGGDLVAGLENRVYFVARDPLGKPVHIEGVVVNPDGDAVALAQTVHEGMGSFTFMPASGRRYRLLIRNPEGCDNEPSLPEANAEREVVLNTGIGVFEPGAPLEFNLRAASPDLPLVVAAYCRGVPVGQTMLVSHSGENGDEGTNAVVIPLADEVSGVVRLTVFDYSQNPPEPVAERLVYRRPSQYLKVQPVEHREKYAPGDKVEMAVVVTDEQGEPIPAAVSVAVVDDSLLNLADDDFPGINTHFLLTTEVKDPQDLEEADFYLSDDPEAAVALDLLLGVQGWRRFIGKTLPQLADEGRDVEPLERLAALGGETRPPAMFDNLGVIRKRFIESYSEYQSERTRLLTTMVTLSFFGGLALLLLVTLLGILKVVTGIHLWVPAVGVTVCCVVVGMIWMNPASRQFNLRGPVAFASFDAAPAAVEAGEAGQRPAGDQLSEKEAEIKPHWKEEKRKKVEEVMRPEDAPADQPGLDVAALDADIPADRKARQQDRLLQNAQRDAFADKDMELKELADARRRLRNEFDKADFTEAEEDLEHYRFAVREYAHRHVAGEPGVRSDFAETLFWSPLRIADENGRVDIAFETSDSLTAFRITADAHGAGRIGSGQAKLISRIPFSVEPKLPLEVNAGDRIDLPVAVVNDTDTPLPVELSIEHGDLVTLGGDPVRRLQLAASGRDRAYYALRVTGQKGDAELTLRGLAGNLADAVKRPLAVVPPGFPRELSYSGRIEGPSEVLVELPESWVEGSLEVTLGAYPSTLAELQQGMEGILRAPCGCFEQASTSNYPNVLSLQYMQQHNVADPGITRRAKQLLNQGYARLTGYECPKKGYEWFGGDPGHEALTAYGLMEFRDMAEVYEVDTEMIRRTAEWLLARRDGQGGFRRNAKALDSFGRAPDAVTNAYITWALSESGQEGIDKEVEHVVSLGDESNDPYVIALAAASAANQANTSAARRLMQKLAKLQDDDGHLDGTQGSITRSGGQSLAVETTALAALAWLKNDEFDARAKKAVEWLVASRSGSGGFGSTQATILALKALVTHAKSSRRTLAAGTLVVKRDDLEIGRHEFSAGRTETIVVDGLEASLEPGANALTITLSGDSQMPYALDVRFRTRKPASDDACPVRLATRLAKKKVEAGETVALAAELRNTSDQGQPMTVALLGLPAGLEPRTEQLDELKEKGTIDYYETRPREVICYWRSLAPKKQVDLTLDLVAAIPGRYVGPASRAYLYYTAEQKQWADPVEVEITRE